MNVNLVALAGRLTRKPELTYVQISGNTRPVVEFALAVNEYGGTDASGQRRPDKVLFVDATAWGKLAETIAEKCDKGATVYIQGRLRMESWIDQRTDIKRTRLYVLVDEFEFAGPPPASTGDP